MLFMAGGGGHREGRGNLPVSASCCDTPSPSLSIVCCLSLCLCGSDMIYSCSLGVGLGDGQNTLTISLECGSTDCKRRQSRYECQDETPHCPYFTRSGACLEQILMPVGLCQAWTGHHTPPIKSAVRKTDDIIWVFFFKLYKSPLEPQKTLYSCSQRISNSSHATKLRCMCEVSVAFSVCGTSSLAAPDQIVGTSCNQFHRVPGFMRTLTGERFRVCVQIWAQVQLGNVLFLSPLAAAVVTHPQSFIHTQIFSFYMHK